MLDDTAARLQQLCEDLSYSHCARWAAAHPGMPLVGYLPAYMPRELVYAAGGLAVGIWGGGIATEIVHGDAYYQSYICRLPRSVIELAKQGAFAPFDGLVFPSICDVIRNLSGMWKILFPKQWVKYLDLPQNLSSSIGGSFYQKEMKHLAEMILKRKPDPQYEENLRRAIALTNRQSELVGRLKQLRHAARVARRAVCVSAGGRLIAEAGTGLSRSCSRFARASSKQCARSSGWTRRLCHFTSMRPISSTPMTPRLRPRRDDGKFMYG